MLRLHRFFRGRPAAPNSFKDLTWFRADGHEMAANDWDAVGARVLGLRISGNAIEELDDEGYPITTPTLLLLLNAGEEDIEFTMPAVNRGNEIDSWKVLLDTNDPRGHSSDFFNEHRAITLKSRTLILCEGLQGPVN